MTSKLKHVQTFNNNKVKSLHISIGKVLDYKKKEKKSARNELQRYPVLIELFWLHFYFHSHLEGIWIGK